MTFDGISILLEEVRGVVWSPPLIILLLFMGGYFTWLLQGIQFRYLMKAFRPALQPTKVGVRGEISPFQALMTTLAGSIGTGNIAGVATALSVGGLGALFWIWLVGLFGMALSFAEALLAVEFRERNERGEMVGGAMNAMGRGLQRPVLAAFFAIATIASTFGLGGVAQVHSLSDAFATLYGTPPLFVGGFTALVTALVIFGGVKVIGRITALLVPFMALLYLIAGVIVIICHLDRLPAAFYLIIESVFSGQAALGGFLGSTPLLALQMGVSRGIFCNEAGLGSVSFAAASAKTESSVEQGLVSMTGSFLSTIVVCTVTGLTLAVTGALSSPEGASLDGAPLAMWAFASTLPLGNEIVTLSLLFFGYSTILAWSFYGERSVDYLGGVRWITPYRLLFCLLLWVGALLPLKFVWNVADIANGCMVLPNLLMLFFLAPLVQRRWSEYSYKRNEILVFDQNAIK